MRHVSDDERRVRLATRHALTPEARLTRPEDVTRALTVLHATEPATIYLSCQARSDTITIADVDRSLYADRTLVRQLAMRRTLFVFERGLLPAAWGSASRRVAAAQRTRMAKDLVAGGIADDGDRWLESVRAEVLEVLAGEPDGLSARDLRARIPALDARVPTTSGVGWSGPQLLTHLGARGDILRGANPHAWPTSRPHWTLPRHWLGDDPVPASAAEGYRELVGRWLSTFGPGTEDDLVWWLGATKSVVRAALAELAAVEVSLERGETGWLAPDDLEEVADPGPWVALLPVLDPTVMGWRGRDFYLGPHRDRLFDTQGNAGTTVWVDGRIVGCWVQDDARTVRIRLLERVSPTARRALDREAARLTQWLRGARVPTVWRSPAMSLDEPD